MISFTLDKNQTKGLMTFKSNIEIRECRNIFLGEIISFIKDLEQSLREELDGVSLNTTLYWLILDDDNNILVRVSNNKDQLGTPMAFEFGVVCSTSVVSKSGKDRVCLEYKQDLLFNISKLLCQMAVQE